MNFLEGLRLPSLKDRFGKRPAENGRPHIDYGQQPHAEKVTVVDIAPQVIDIVREQDLPQVVVKPVVETPKYTFREPQRYQVQGMLSRTGLSSELNPDLIQRYAELQEAEYNQPADAEDRHPIRSDQQLLDIALAESAGVGTAFMFRAHRVNNLHFPHEAEFMGMLEKKNIQLPPEEAVVVNETFNQLKQIQQEIPGPIYAKGTIFELALDLTGNNGHK